MRMVPILAACLLPSCPQNPAPVLPRPVDVFADLDGRWRGSFVGWDETGTELYRIAVDQTYETVSPTEQILRVRDRMADGTVVTGTGKNVALRGKDGSLTLRCIVDKSTGEHVEHSGRIVRGPGGRREIVWYSGGKDRSETFREGVETCGGKTFYYIQGMGRYGPTEVLMAGRYAKQP